jgi:GTP:adenosylcobinamide-phosphate guanylyltransferase
MNNQTNCNNNTVSKYVVTGDSTVSSYPVKNTTDINKSESRKEIDTKAEQRRAREALKLQNPFKGF